VSLVRAAVFGNLRAAMDAEVVRVAAALKRAVTTAGQQTQADLRAQARGAGFKDGGRSIANAWRLKVYPTSGVGLRSFKPAADVTSNMPDVVAVFDKGITITVKKSRYLAIPTPINRAGNRRTGRDGRFEVRVTPLEMFRSGGFVIPTSNPRVRLWCLPLRQEATKRGRVKLFAGRYVQVLTGNRKGAQAARKAYAADRKFVPMFFLMRQVNLRKRLDIAAVRALAPGRFARAAAQELARGAGR
jgi:hypothetical protein